MTVLARRRRARFERRKVMPEDPENGWRQRDCRRQMHLFDQLPDPVRSQIRDAADDTDVVQLIGGIEQRGPSDRVRAILKARGVMACDVPPEELIALELEQRS